MFPWKNLSLDFYNGYMPFPPKLFLTNVNFVFAVLQKQLHKSVKYSINLIALCRLMLFFIVNINSAFWIQV